MAIRPDWPSFRVAIPGPSQARLWVGFNGLALPRSLRAQIRRAQSLPNRAPPVAEGEQGAPASSGNWVHQSRQTACAYGVDTFEIPGRAGPHVCITHEPLSLSLKDICELAGGEVPEALLKPIVLQILLALDYLHSVAHVVHTDIQGNIMLSVDDQSIFDDVIAE